MVLALIRLTILVGPTLLLAGVWSVAMAIYNGPDRFWPVLVPVLLATAFLLATVALYRRHKSAAIVLFFLMWLMPLSHYADGLSLGRRGRGPVPSSRMPSAVLRRRTPLRGVWAPFRGSSLPMMAQ